MHNSNSLVRTYGSCVHTLLSKEYKMKKLIFLLSILVFSAALSLDASARYKGDLNGDDRVDLADMVYLAKAIKAGSTDKALDVNASGKVDDYDLQKLADIIISGKMTEDSGLNVGIGGWEDPGEDFGGTVKAPAIDSRNYEDIRFFTRNVQYVEDDLYSQEYGLSMGSEAPCAILFSLQFPWHVELYESMMVDLEESLSLTHKLYGTPIYFKKDDGDDWSDRILRFIVFSPELQPLQEVIGSLGKIYIKYGHWETPLFTNCQVAFPGSDHCVYIEEHRFVDVYSMRLSENDIYMTVGDTYTITASIEPEDATNKTIIWSSAEDRVAKVTGNGCEATITALSPGWVLIYATAFNGWTAECSIHIDVPPGTIYMDDIVLDAENLSLNIGDTHQFNASIYPENTTYPDLYWWVDDEEVAVVDQNGLLTIIGEGATLVHVRSVTWFEIEATCHLDVKAGVDGIIVDDSPIDIYSPSGTLLRKQVLPSEIEYLDHGLYFIRQGGKTTKLLK